MRRQQAFKPNQYRVEGDVAFLILTGKGGSIVGESKIDLADLDRVLSSGRCYRVMVRKCTRLAEEFYPVALFKVPGSRRTQLLHRFLLDAPEGTSVDHINHDTLDNRRCNLRLVNHSQNAQNTFAHRDSKSGVRNVYWNESDQCWLVQVCVNYKRTSFGTFKTIAEAAEVAKKARIAMHTHCPENSVAAGQARAQGRRGKAMVA